MIGTRVYGKEPHELVPGEYGRFARDHNNWYAHCPGEDDLVANLSGHRVTEHPDGTITVEPSILCGDGRLGHSWHGYLQKGVWKQC